MIKTQFSSLKRLPWKVLLSSNKLKKLSRMIHTFSQNTSISTPHPCNPGSFLMSYKKSERFFGGLLRFFEQHETPMVAHLSSRDGEKEKRPECQWLSALLQWAVLEMFSPWYLDRRESREVGLEQAAEGYWNGKICPGLRCL